MNGAFAVYPAGGEQVLGVEYLEAIAPPARPVRRPVHRGPATEPRTKSSASGPGSPPWPSTKDRDVYQQVHLAGKKCDYDYRLDTPARAAAAGMREVGIGALLGLADWRAEEPGPGHAPPVPAQGVLADLVHHQLSRLRPATGEFQPLVPVSEKNLSQLIFALRIFDHDVGLILSTREEARYRDGMIGLGPTRYSAGSCTAPGGYAHPEWEGEQFSVGDHRNISEVSNALIAKGLDPVYKDWDKEFQVVSG